MLSAIEDLDRSGVLATRHYCLIRVLLCPQLLGREDYRELGLNILPDPTEAWSKQYLATGQPMRMIDIHALDVLFPVERGRPGARTNVTLDMVINFAIQRKSRDWLKNWLSYFHPSWSNAAVTGVLLACLNESTANEYLVIFDRTILQNQPLVDAAKALSELHTLYRKYSVWPRLGVLDEKQTLLQYAQTLLNRSNQYRTDFSDELYMRTWIPYRKTWIQRANDGTFYGNADKWDEEFDVELQGLIAELYSKLKGRRQWSCADWWARVLNWMPSGSVAGRSGNMVIDDVHYKIKYNKRLLLTELRDEELEQALNQLAPALATTLAVKYEVSKNRTIWNTLVEFFVAMSLFMQDIEGAVDCTEWENGGSRSMLEEALIRLKVLDGNNGVMFDAADFNVNHGLQEQARMYQLMGQAMIEHFRCDAPSEVIQLATFLATAHQRVVMRYGRILGVGRRSLISGSRATAWTNNIFNIVYNRVVIRNYQALFGVANQPIRYLRLKGDDTAAATKYAHEGLLYSALMILSAIAGQSIKLLNERNLGDFLRHNIDARRQKTSGFLLRAVSSLVCGEFFGLSVGNIYDRYSAFIQQVELLRNRGLDNELGTYLLEQCRYHKCAVVRTWQGSKQRLLPESRVFHTSIFHGGTGQLPGKDYALGQLPKPTWTIPRELAGHFGRTQTDKLLANMRLPPDLQDKVHTAVVSQVIGTALPPPVVSSEYVRMWMPMQQYGYQIRQSPIATQPQDLWHLFELGQSYGRRVNISNFLMRSHERSHSPSGSWVHLINTSTFGGMDMFELVCQETKTTNMFDRLKLLYNSRPMRDRAEVTDLVNTLRRYVSVLRANWSHAAIRRVFKSPLGVDRRDIGLGPVAFAPLNAILESDWWHSVMTRTRLAPSPELDFFLFARGWLSEISEILSFLKRVYID